MTYIDTHAHLYSDAFEEDRSDMIQRALDAGVNKLFLPNIDEASIEGMETLVEKYPGVCYSMMGIHPCDVQKDWQAQMQRIQQFFKPERHIAIGEIGIDLYWDKSLQEEQTASFRAQIQWAKSVQLPIVIHCRDSFDEIFAVLDEENDDHLSGIFHCFTGTAEQGRRILDYGGFKLGIGGVVTFKNSGLDKAIAELGPEHLVLETDAPYLTPTPYRGKRNESAYIPLIAEKLSSIFSIDEKEIGNITSRNALEIFKLPKH
jgi:TatD DNase family protein